MSAQQACPWVSSGQESPGTRPQHVIRIEDEKQGGSTALDWARPELLPPSAWVRMTQWGG